MDDLRLQFILLALPGLLVEQSLNYSVVGVLFQSYGVEPVFGLGRDLD